MQKYKILKSYLGKRVILRAGSITERQPNHPKTKLLIDNGFISPVDQFKTIVTSELAKVEIADKDYTEGDKIHFTYEEALEIEKKLKGTDWRLPTRSEWALICEEFGCDNDGKLNGQLLIDKLELGLNGYVATGSLNRAGAIGYYWASTAYSPEVAYYLGFNSGALYPSYSHWRFYGFSIRLVRDIEEEL